MAEFIEQEELQGSFAAVDEQAQQESQTTETTQEIGRAHV